MRREAADLVIGDAQRLPTGRRRRQGADNPPAFLAGGDPTLARHFAAVFLWLEVGCGGALPGPLFGVIGLPGSGGHDWARGLKQTRPRLRSCESVRVFSY
jgi:hypothetical protein